MYHVYILSSNNNTTLYVGVTNDLTRRVFEHKQKSIDGFTKKYNVNKLVYFEQTSNIENAILREKQIKGYRREIKNRLISQNNPEWKDLFDYLFLRYEQIYFYSK